jgi:hypothetical protein
MNDSTNQDLKHLLYPYTFVLSEGKKIKKNYLDYSLCMLQVGFPETIQSPIGLKIRPNMTRLSQALFERNLSSR